MRRSPTTHEEAVTRWLQANGIGVEIGAGRTPVPGIRPFYVDRFAEFAGERTLADYWGDACHLPFHDDSLDYVVSSHVLEHAANPVAALAEWHRVLRGEGIIYAVVPDRRYTFDHRRALTDPRHMWEDFEARVDQSDGTHIDEFVDDVDWSLFRPDLPPESVSAAREELRRQYHIAKRGGEINIHFHVFEPSNLRALVELTMRNLEVQWEILDICEQFPKSCPNGILLVVRVHKDRWSRFHARLLRGWTRRRPERVLRADARPISEDAELRQRY